MRLAIDLAIVGLIVGLLIGYFAASAPLLHKINSEQSCVASLINSAKAYTSGQRPQRITTLSKSAYLAAIDDARFGAAEWNIAQLYGCTSRYPDSPVGPDIEAMILWEIPFADVKSRFGQPRPEWKLKDPLIQLGTL